MLLAFGAAIVIGVSLTSPKKPTEDTSGSTAGNQPVNPVGRPDTSGEDRTQRKAVALPAELRNASLQTVDGKSLKLSDYSNKAVIVNLWATWCGPCRIEMPELVKLSKEYKARGLEVIGLTTQQNDPDVGSIKSFARSQNVDYDIVWDDGSFTGPLVEAVHGHGVIPQSFLISRDGKVLVHFEGFSPISTPTQMRRAVEAALSDKS
jgi:thiol-disulfide isomerase/thioredoxin